MQTFANDPIKAGIWMMGSVLSFTLMAVAGRQVLHELDTFEVMAYRSLMGVFVVLVIAKASGTIKEINTQQLRLHLTRNITHFIGQNLWFFALNAITLAQLFAFEFSVPVWVALFAPFFLSEKLTLKRFTAASIGFIGILIVARPDQIGLTPGNFSSSFMRNLLHRNRDSNKTTNKKAINNLYLILVNYDASYFGGAMCGI